MSTTFAVAWRGAAAKTSAMVRRQRENVERRRLDAPRRASSDTSLSSGWLSAARWLKPLYSNVAAFPGGTHWQMFERNGVPHYWLAEWRSRTIRQYTLIGEAYVGGRYGDPVVLREADTLTSSLFPGLSLPVARVFRYVRRR